MICPICNQNVQVYPQTEMPCECCKSIIYEDENSEPRVIKSRVSFSLTNFIKGIFILFGFLLLCIFYLIGGISHTVTGFAMISILIMLVLQQLVFLRSVNFKSNTDLYNALIKGNLKYYDFGSKFLVIVIILIPLTGFGLILYDLIN